MISDETKHSISAYLVDSMNAVERREITVGEFNECVDDIATQYPGGEQQQKFYRAVKELATKSNPRLMQQISNAFQ